MIINLYKLKNFFTKTNTGIIPKWKWKIYIYLIKFENYFNFNFKLQHQIGLFFWWIKWILLKDVPKNFKYFFITLKSYPNTNKTISIISKIKMFLYYLWNIKFTNWI